MKTLRNLFLFSTICFFVSCGSDSVIDRGDDEDNEPVKELLLSVDNGNRTLSFDGIETEFEILDGNGDYTVTSSDENAAKVRLEGTKVYVDFISYHTDVTITVTDKKSQQKSLSMVSYAKSLVSPGHTLFTELGKTYIDKYVSFGAGGYTIETISGTSAKATVNENDEIVVEGIEFGNSYFKITDRRGTTATYDVIVIATYELDSESMSISAKRDQIISIKLLYGNGWKLVDFTNALFDGVYMHNATDTECASVQVDTSKEVIGQGVVKIINDEGQPAVITISVE
ncbi:hypothetical protein D0T84_06585 [Dysgonomonas sp. 521]|uniref:hypothetical protein n=1 Tax=Dysgonomonas sp. 521 TaxID=2302932 RepID=UPI0013D026C2|nr:hypothetical protein [Dysgonomonas sp. 521]NDV94588.1 hypothetical protein [Dysgonomonas sp. 521]